jgi:hypothetical protein
MTPDYNSTDWKWPCVCGHLREKHWGIPLVYFNAPFICVQCEVQHNLSFKHSFKLDNLSYVEELAKKRNLI